jgi:3-deoxy-D-arabino-heptulosonate 7-phosphate (DAHP) synthase
LSLGSLAAGACGLIVEVHPDPSKAMSDGAQSLDIPMFAELAAKLRADDGAGKRKDERTVAAAIVRSG